MDVVGVDGRTFTELCGEREGRRAWGRADEWTEFEVDEVDEALEWVCTW